VNFPRPVRAAAYRTFYRLPSSARRRIARLVAPRYVVGAVTIVRDSEAPEPGRLLLLRQPPGRGWGLPAGLLKHRERPAVGAARELYEESGIRLDPDDLSPGVPNAIVHTVGVVDTIWFAEVPASATTLKVDGGEVLEAAWFPIDELPRLAHGTAALLGRFGMGPHAS
jgi:8-oxo-dGTP pyrophosphatase MutT (NUDIX family)